MYLALLNWQGQKITFDDFQALDQAKSIEDIQKAVQQPSVKDYILNNKTWWRSAERQLKACRQSDIKLTWPGQEDYPQLLYLYKNSPTLLSYKGHPCWNHYFKLCVVGSRKIHSQTSKWMDHHLSSFLSQHDIYLLSGGARGVDQKGHSLAIRASRPTLCFLPCGLDFLYPSSLEEWVEPVIKNKGAFISPFPPDYQIRRSFFHYRNSLMVRMSQVVLIMQAEKRSGSMLTARLASLYGVTLCVIPGPAMDSLFSGNLDLINDGALMVRDQLDLSAIYYCQKN